MILPYDEQFCESYEKTRNKFTIERLSLKEKSVEKYPVHLYSTTTIIITIINSKDDHSM